MNVFHSWTGFGWICSPRSLFSRHVSPLKKTHILAIRNLDFNISVCFSKNKSHIRQIFLNFCQFTVYPCRPKSCNRKTVVLYFPHWYRFLAGLRQPLPGGKGRRGWVEWNCFPNFPNGRKVSSRAECDFQCHIPVDVGTAEDYRLSRNCDLLRILGDAGRQCFRYGNYDPFQRHRFHHGEKLGLRRVSGHQARFGHSPNQILGQIYNLEMFFLTSITSGTNRDDSDWRRSPVSEKARGRSSRCPSGKIAVNRSCFFGGQNRFPQKERRAGADLRTGGIFQHLPDPPGP